MTKVVTDLLEGQSVGQQFGCARMTQRVWSEVSGLNVECVQSLADDGVDGRGEDGYSGRL